MTQKTTQTDPIVEAVRAKLLQRSQVGLQKYGTTLMRDDIDLYGWLNHLSEELMDAVLYVERAMHEVKNGTS